jgi:hypothetical protein
MKSTSATTSIGGRDEPRAPKGITLRRVWTDTPIGRIHARVGGEALDGPPVVLVHGDGDFQSLHGADRAGARHAVPGVRGRSTRLRRQRQAARDPWLAGARRHIGRVDGRHAIPGCASRRELIWVSGPGGVHPATCPSRGPIGLSGSCPASPFAPCGRPGGWSDRPLCNPCAGPTRWHGRRPCRS